MLRSPRGGGSVRGRSTGALRKEKGRANAEKFFAATSTRVVVDFIDEEMDGIGYKLALPPPRHAKLNDFRVLVIDKHPLCPTVGTR